MPILVREHPLYFFLRGISRIRRLFLTVAVAASIIFLWLTLFYYPSRVTLVQYKRTLAVLRGKQHDLEQRVKQHSELLDGFLLSSTSNDLTCEGDAFALLIECCRSSGVVCNKVVPHAASSDQKSLQTFRVEAVATFDSLINFFGHMYRYRDVVTFHDFHIVRRDVMLEIVATVRMCLAQCKVSSDE